MTRGGMDVISIQLTSSTTVQQSNVDGTTFKRHVDDQQLYNKTPASLVVATNEHQHGEQQHYEEDFSSSSSSTSLVSWTTTAEQDNKKIITDDPPVISSSSASSNADDNDEEVPPTMTTTTVTESIPNAWQSTTVLKKQILDYRENRSDNNNLTPHHQYNPPQEQRSFIMRSEAKKSINSTTVESLSITENHQEESTATSRMIQFTGPQKRISKRAHRSSDHHKRAVSSSQNRKLHANNNNVNKANNNATLPSIANNTITEASSSPSTTTTKNSAKQDQEVEDRVVRSDEIALFMRSKKRYSDPDFKPIPPLPGGWDEVTPDRVIAWEQTAEMLNEFSSYKQNDPDWNNKLPWVRHHRHHHYHEKDMEKKSTSLSLSLSASSGIMDKDATVSNTDNNVNVTAASNKAMTSNNISTRHQNKNDILSNNVKQITRQKNVPWKPTPSQLDCRNYHYKQHYHPLPPANQPSYCTISNPPVITPLITNDSTNVQGSQKPQTPTSTLVNGNNNNNNNNNTIDNKNTRISRPTPTNATNFSDRFLTQPELLSKTQCSSQQLLEQNTPFLWGISNSSHQYNNSNFNKYNDPCQPSYNNSNNMSNNNNGRRSSTFSLDTQTDNHQALHLIPAARRLSYGYNNKNSIYQQENQQSQQRKNDSFITSSCSPWSPTLSEWSSKYRGPISPPSHQQDWTPPVSPWSIDNNKRNVSFSSDCLESLPSSSTANSDNNNINTWEERFASILKVVEDDTATKTTSATPLYYHNQQQKQDIWPLSPPPSAGGIIDYNHYQHRNNDYSPMQRRSSCNDAYYHHSNNHQQQQQQQQPRNLWNNNNNSGDTTKKATASPPEAGGLLVANSQLLQNMAQTGHMRCRRCGSPTHSTSKECPHIPFVNDQDAWIQLLQAGHRCDTTQFMEAIDIYSKSRPNETFPMIARRLQDAGSKLQLVALEKPLLSTTILVDLQGIMHRKYTVTAMVFPQPSPPLSNNHNNYYYGSASLGYNNNNKVAMGVPESTEQNIARLTEAGFAQNLTEMTWCMLCKQPGHWAKDCFAAHHPPPPPLLSLSMPSTQQRRPFDKNRQQSTPNIFSFATMDSKTTAVTAAPLSNNSESSSLLTRGRFNSLPPTDTLFNDNSTDYIAITQPTTPSSTRSTTKQFSVPITNGTEDHTTRRLYYSLNEYVLVDGI